MKLFIKIFFFKIFSVIFFTFLYNYLSTDFEIQTNDKIKFIDCFLLSTTVEAGVGVSNMYPTNFLGKLAMIIHQISMISTHVFTIYILSL